MPDHNLNKSTIILSAGGTMGSVTPLLVLAEELRGRYNFIFVGAYSGIEREVVTKIDYLKYQPLISGKYRRYFSLYNILDLFKIIFAFWQALYFLKKTRPALVLSAGSFVSVPLVWAAQYLKIPVLIHQQDIRPGLANRLMAPTAKIITTTFEKSVADYGAKAVWVGNPCRLPDSGSLARMIEAFRLKPELPLVLVLGGSTGSQALNFLLANSLEELSKICQVIHVTGQNKQINKSILKNYQAYEFLDHDKVLALMTRADLVISRAGLSTLTELSSLAKPTILVPLPKTHQEDNANLFLEREAAVVLRGGDLKPDKLVETVKEILENDVLRAHLRKNIKDIMPSGANEALKLIINSLVENKSVH